MKYRLARPNTLLLQPEQHPHLPKIAKRPPFIRCVRHLALAIPLAIACTLTSVTPAHAYSNIPAADIEKYLHYSDYDKPNFQKFIIPEEGGSRGRTTYEFWGTGPGDMHAVTLFKAFNPAHILTNTSSITTPKGMEYDMHAPILESNMYSSRDYVNNLGKISDLIEDDGRAFFNSTQNIINSSLAGLGLPSINLGYLSWTERPSRVYWEHYRVIVPDPDKVASLKELHVDYRVAERTLMASISTMIEGFNEQIKANLNNRDWDYDKTYELQKLISQVHLSSIIAESARVPNWQDTVYEAYLATAVMVRSFGVQIEPHLAASAQEYTTRLRETYARRSYLEVQDNSDDTTTITASVVDGVESTVIPSVGQEPPLGNTRF